MDDEGWRAEAFEDIVTAYRVLSGASLSPTQVRERDKLGSRLGNADRRATNVVSYLSRHCCRE